MSAEGSGTIPLVEQVGIIGGAAWVEQRLFELEGRWSADEVDLELAVHLATNSRYHGWHAELLADCLPDSPSLEADAHVVAPTRGWAALLSTLDDPAPDWPDGALARAVTLARVILPHTIAGYEALATRLTPVSDGALLRALGHIVADQDAEREAVEGFARARLAGGEDAEAAAQLVARLEQLLVAPD